jgi:hypothetical protein
VQQALEDKKRIHYLDYCEAQLKESDAKVSKLQEENTHFLYLERLNIEYKTYEPRLKQLELKELEI